MKLELA